MIYFIKKYWKYVLIVFCCIILFTFAFLYNTKEEKISIDNEKKLSVTKKLISKEQNTTSDNVKTVFVDVKGAVNAPGVYELENTKRVIDAINLAGGLSDNANTINLNLSKKLEDEMYIIVYTKKEIADFKKNNSSSEITCASNECLCPDTNNEACINKNSNKNSSNAKASNSSINSKVSINTANKEELMTLSGIGESKANAIISYRQENGNFKMIEDIKNVSGIGDAVYQKIKDNITL